MRGWIDEQLGPAQARQPLVELLDLKSDVNVWVQVPVREDSRYTTHDPSLGKVEEGLGLG